MSSIRLKYIIPARGNSTWVFIFKFYLIEKFHIEKSISTELFKLFHKSPENRFNAFTIHKIFWQMNNKKSI